MKRASETLKSFVSLTRGNATPFLTVHVAEDEAAVVSPSRHVCSFVNAAERSVWSWTSSAFGNDNVLEEDDFADVTLTV